MEEQIRNDAAAALRQFRPQDAVLGLVRHGSGHIHDTFLAAVRETPEALAGLLRA